MFRGQQMHIHSAGIAAETTTALPGTLLAAKNRLSVACGDGTALEILELQLEGRKRMSAEAFRNGQRLTAFDILGEKTN